MDLSVFLFEFPLFLLLTLKGKTGVLISAAVYLFVCAVILFLRKGKTENSLKLRYPIPAILICLAGGAVFYFRWNHTQRVLALAARFEIPYKQAALILASFLGMAALFGADILTGALMQLVRKKGSDHPETGPSGSGTVFFTRFILFLTAFLLIGLNSQSSPLYPFNTWDDANTIFTVGKSILKGLVPYRDLYEQKGPLLLFLQVPAALISFTEFWGLWIIEVISAFSFLALAFKTGELFMGKRILPFIPILGFFIYNSRAFWLGGSAEEFCLPLIMYSVFVGCKALKNKNLPSNTEFLLVGITSGCVFWIKYSMVGFYLGWFLSFLVFSVKEGTLTSLFRKTAWIAGGVVLVTIPVITYFLKHSAVRDLFECYFYNNLFLYPDERVLLKQKIQSGIGNFYDNGMPVLFLSLFGSYWLALQQKKKESFLLIVSFCGLFLGVYSGGHFYNYYSLIFSIYAVFGLCCLLDFTLSIFSDRIKLNSDLYTSVSCFLFLSIFLMSIYGHNMFLLKHGKEDLMQYQMKTILEEKGLENPSVLSLPRGDLGIYTVMGNVPNLLFSCSYNNDQFTAIKESHDQYIAEQNPDIIIYYSGKNYSFPEYDTYTYMGYVEGVFNYNYGYYHYYFPANEGLSAEAGKS